jgi:hypothetical protein
MYEILLFTNHRFLSIDYFDLIDCDKKEVIEKENYQQFLQSLTQGLIPLGNFEDEAIDQIWMSIVEQCDSQVLTREHFGQLLSLADLHIYMTVSF